MIKRLLVKWLLPEINSSLLNLGKEFNDVWGVICCIQVQINNQSTRLDNMEKNQ